MEPTCHKCNSIKFCNSGRKSKLENCPMRISKDILNQAREIYENNEEIKLATKNASIVEAEGYMKWPRLKDTIQYATRMGYKKIGLAFCVGLLKEARKIAEIIEKYDLQVCSVSCKTGSVSKTDVGVPEEFTMKSKTGYMIGFITCNPAGQALLLNNCKTDMNIICGLCVGHDISFTKLSEAPVTTLVAKDRSTVHCPAAVLFSHYGESFFSEDIRSYKNKV